MKCNDKKQNKWLEDSMKLGELQHALDKSFPIVIFAPTGKIIDVSPKFQKLSKYTLNEIKNKNISIFLDKKYHPKLFFKSIFKFLQSNRIWIGELRGKTRKSDAFCVNGVIIQQLEGQNHPYQYLLIMQDITSQKRNEESVRRLATVVSDSSDAIIMLDLKGKIIAWNKGAKIIYGYSEKEALSMNIADIIPEDSKDETISLINKIYSGEKVKSLETKRITKSGAVLDIWLTATKLVDDNGNIVAVATTGRDITEHNKMLFSLSQATRQIVSTQEKERKRIAQEIHDDFGQSLIALKMYLTGIIPEVIEKQPELNDVSKNMVEQLNEIIEKARNLSHELYPPSLKTIGLIGAIKDLIDKFEHFNGIKIRFIHRDLKDINFESNGIIIYRIIQEALTNAIKNAKASKVELSIIHKAKNVHLLIKDNGIGFSVKDLDKHKSGLGLVIMKERALLMGATFEIKSAKGDGTSIIIKIPVQKEES